MTDQSAESEESRSATDDPAPSGKIPPFSIWWTGGRSAGGGMQREWRGGVLI